MSLSFFLRSINSDLSVGGALFNRKLLEDTGTATTQEVSLTANQTLDAYAFTEPGMPGDDGDPGDYTVSIHVTSGATQINNSVRLARVNSSGVVQAEGGFSTPDVGNAGVKVHEFEAFSLGTWNVGDRLRVQYRFQNTDSMMARSLTIEVNTQETELITPWTIGGDPPRTLPLIEDFSQGDHLDPITTENTIFDFVDNAPVFDTGTMREAVSSVSRQFVALTGLDEFVWPNVHIQFKFKHDLDPELDTEFDQEEFLVLDGGVTFSHLGFSLMIHWERPDHYQLHEIENGTILQPPIVEEVPRNQTVLLDIALEPSSVEGTKDGSVTLRFYLDPDADVEVDLPDVVWTGDSGIKVLQLLSLGHGGGSLDTGEFRCYDDLIVHNVLPNYASIPGDEWADSVLPDENSNIPPITVGSDTYAIAIDGQDAHIFYVFKSSDPTDSESWTAVGQDVMDFETIQSISWVLAGSTIHIALKGDFSVAQYHAFNTGTDTLGSREEISLAPTSLGAHMASIDIALSGGEPTAVYAADWGLGDGHAVEWRHRDTPIGGRWTGHEQFLDGSDGWAYAGRIVSSGDVLYAFYVDLTAGPWNVWYTEIDFLQVSSPVFLDTAVSQGFYLHELSNAVMWDNGETGDDYGVLYLDEFGDLGFAAAFTSAEFVTSAPMVHSDTLSASLVVDDQGNLHAVYVTGLGDVRYIQRLGFDDWGNDQELQGNGTATRVHAIWDDGKVKYIWDDNGVLTYSEFVPTDAGDSVSPANSSVSVSSTEPTLTQKHAIQPEDSAVSVQTTEATTSVASNVGADDSSVNVVSTEPTLTQKHIIQPDDSVVSVVTTEAVLAAAGVIGVDDTSVGVSTTEPTLVQSHVIQPDNTSVGVVSTQPNITPSGTTYTSGSEVVQDTVVQADPIVPDDSIVSVVSTEPTLSHKYTVQPHNSSVGVSTEEPTLTQSHTLQPADSQVVVITEESELSSAGHIGVTNTSVNVTTTEPSLTQSHTIQPDNSIVEVNTAEAGLTQSHSLQPDNSIVLVEFTQPSIIQAHTLQVDNSVVSVSTAQATISTAGTINPDDSIVAVSSSEVGLTQSHILIPDDSQSQVFTSATTVSASYTISVDSSVVAVSTTEPDLDVAVGLIQPHDSMVVVVTTQPQFTTSGFRNIDVDPLDGPIVYTTVSDAHLSALFIGETHLGPLGISAPSVVFIEDVSVGIWIVGEPHLGPVAVGEPHVGMIVSEPAI